MTEPRLIADRYRLDERIGSGAMGVVWRAHDTRLQRPVAVKQLLLQPGLSPAEAEDGRARAMREGRIAARLQHPNAIGVFDVALGPDGAGTEPWLVMEYLPSRSLATVLAEQGPLPPRETARIGRQVADALAAAHAAGIVHRDVKPGNVLLGEDGTVKITDFGISRASWDVTVTRTGVLAGTPAYFAPEVARGEVPSHASDVFSLGATLYTAVEGEPPFGLDDNTLALLRAVAEGTVHPPQRAGPLHGVLMQLLRPEPAERPVMPAARDLLGGIASGSGAARSRSAAPPRTAMVPAAAAAGAAAAGTPAAGAPPWDAAPPSTEAPSPAAGPPTAGPATAGPPWGAVSPPPPPERPSSSASPAPWWRRPTVLGAAALVLLVLLGAAAFAVRGTGGGEPITAAPAPSAAPPTPAPSTPPPTTATPEPAPPPAPPAPGPEQFAQTARDYYALLPDQLDVAYAYLGPGVREMSGGREAYGEFWSRFQDVGTQDVQANGSTVTLTIVYTRQDGSTFTEPYTLEMATANDGRVIIASSEIGATGDVNGSEGNAGDGNSGSGNAGDGGDGEDDDSGQGRGRGRGGDDDG